MEKEDVIRDYNLYIGKKFHYGFHDASWEIIKFCNKTFTLEYIGPLHRGHGGTLNFSYKKYPEQLGEEHYLKPIE